MNATAKPPASKAPVIWIGVLVVVVIAGVVAIVAAKGSNKKEAEKVTAASIAPVTITGAPLPAMPQAGEDTAIGVTLPQIDGTSLEGKPLSIGPDGKAKLIMGVAHWCPHCQREVPIVVDHLKDSPMPDDVELVGVSTSVKPDADNYPPTAWLKREGFPAPVMADNNKGEAGGAIGLSSFPYFLAVDADGKVVQRTSGEITMEQFDALVKAAQTGKAQG